MQLSTIIKGIIGAGLLTVAILLSIYEIIYYIAKKNENRQLPPGKKIRTRLFRRLIGAMAIIGIVILIAMASTVPNGETQDAQQQKAMIQLVYYTISFFLALFLFIIVFWDIKDIHHHLDLIPDDGTEAKLADMLEASLKQAEEKEAKEEKQD